MNEISTVSILGCGWLGCEVALSLKSSGYRIFGSTTRRERFDEIHMSGAEPVEIDMRRAEASKSEEFWQSSVLILSLPPQTRNDAPTHHLQQVQAALKLYRPLAGSGLVMYFSSISIFSANQGTVRETTSPSPTEANGRACLLAETAVREQSTAPWSIIRFAGLVGPDRHPGRFLAHRRDLPNGATPINLIHKADAAGIVVEVLRQNAVNEVFHAVCDDHRSRREFYTQATAAIGLPVPEFRANQDRDLQILNTPKIVLNEKVKSHLGYRFEHAILSSFTAT